jgi:hypothetical protein
VTDIIGQIFAAKIAAAYREQPSRAGEPYRPGSGTEGMAFDDKWCSHCARDAKFRETDDGADGCQILSASFLYEKTDPNYPKEWVYDREGTPCCTAFTTDPTCPVRCDRTLELFSQERTDG